MPRAISRLLARAGRALIAAREGREPEIQPWPSSRAVEVATLPARGRRGRNGFAQPECASASKWR